MFKNIQFKENEMIGIVCVDDNFGMMFNNRRLSQDKVVTEKILDISKNSKLWLCRFSYSLFDKINTANINIDDNFLSEAAQGEYCFIENKELIPYEKWFEKIIVFKWNRKYPSDFQLDIDLTSWKLIETNEFVGNSHKNITMEVYTK